MRILIDADGCPVTMEAVKIGNEYGVESIIFCDTSHEFNIKNVRLITVGNSVYFRIFVLIMLIIVL